MGDRRSLLESRIVRASCLAVPLLAITASVASAREERGTPDYLAMSEAVRGASLPGERYVSARAVTHYLRARVAREDGDEAAVISELKLASVYDPQSAWPLAAMAEEHWRRGDVRAAEQAARDALAVEPQHARSLYVLARVERGRGKSKRAAELLSSAVQREPLAEPLWMLVQVQLERGQLDLARAALDRLDALAQTPNIERGSEAIRALPLAADAMGAVAKACETAGRNADAEALFVRAIERDPTGVAHRDALVAFLAERGRPAEAAAVASRALGLAGFSAARVANVARLHLDAGDLPAAAAYVEVLATAKGSDGDGIDDALVLLGDGLLAAGASELAAHAFAAAWRLDSSRADAAYSEGLAWSNLGEWGQAATALRRVPSSDRFALAARARLALCEHRQGRSESAERELRRLAAERPESVDIALVLAEVVEARGNRDEALALLEARGAADSRVVHALAMAYRRAGRTNDAAALLARETASRPDDVELQSLFAQVLHLAGERAGAEEVARATLMKAPKRAELLNLVAWILVERKGSLVEAERLARQATTLVPRRAEYLDTLGWVLVRARRALDAVEVLRRAVELAPADGDVRLHLAEALADAGRRDEARSEAEYVRVHTPGLGDAAGRLIERLAGR